MQASRLMIDKADSLVALWDSKPARGYGGTADIVAYARENGPPATVVWPPGATATSLPPCSPRSERRNGRDLQ